MEVIQLMLFELYPIQVQQIKTRMKTQFPNP